MKLLLFGTGGHARVVADAIARRGEHEVVGIVDEAGNETYRDRIEEAGAEGAVIALGDTRIRRKLSEEVSPRLPLVVVVHPRAHVAGVLGEGTVVMAGAVLNPGAVVGRGVIVNTSASVDHDCRIGDFTHICPGVTVAGHVEIGENSWIGVGSVIVDHVTIGSNAFVSAGSIVTRDIPSNHKVIGRRVIPK